MSGNVSFAPYGTNQPANAFLSPTTGYIQGMPMDDPAVRMELAGGTLATTETVVMWGGIPITEAINQLTTGSEGLGPPLKRAVSQATVTGWSTYQQAASMVIVPGGGAPVAGTGNFVAFYRTGSNCRLAVACDPALVAALTAGEAINGAALYWDVTAYRVTLSTAGSNFALPTATRLLSVQTNSKIVTYANSLASWAAGDAALIQF